jgi:hypothetical protein
LAITAATSWLIGGLFLWLSFSAMISFHMVVAAISFFIYVFAEVFASGEVDRMKLQPLPTSRFQKSVLVFAIFNFIWAGALVLTARAF